MVNKMNEILKISINEVSKYKEKYKDVYIVELDGKEIKNWNDYINLAIKFFKLEWLEYDANQHVDNMTSIELVLDYTSFLLIVYNYNEFMNRSKKDKMLFEEAYREDLLPWYDSEIVKCKVEGKRVDFNVLLIED